jgi:hypothetical protein
MMKLKNTRRIIVITATLITIVANSAVLIYQPSNEWRQAAALVSVLLGAYVLSISVRPEKIVLDKQD